MRTRTKNRILRLMRGIMGAVLFFVLLQGGCGSMLHPRKVEITLTAYDKATGLPLEKFYYTFVEGDEDVGAAAYAPVINSGNAAYVLGFTEAVCGKESFFIDYAPSMDFYVYAEGYAIAHEMLRKPRKQEAVRVALVPDTGIQGIVLDPAGNPIPETEVYLNARRMMLAGFALPSFTKSDSAGSFYLPTMTTPIDHLVFVHPDFALALTRFHQTAQRYASPSQSDPPKHSRYAMMPGPRKMLL